MSYRLLNAIEAVPSKGEFGGEGRVWKDEERRIVRRGVRRMRRGRRRDIVACVCVWVLRREVVCMVGLSW